MIFELWLVVVLYLYLFYTIIELHDMDASDFSIRSRNWIVWVMNIYLVDDIYFVYVEEAFITLT